MFAFVSTFVRRLVVPLAALMLVILGSQLTAVAAAPADTPEQAQRHYAEAKIRSWSQSVVELQLLGVDGVTYTGTGVFVTDDTGGLYLMTADHVLKDQDSRFGKQLMLRPFNADPDNSSAWIDITEVSDAAQNSPELDLAVFRLNAPLPGMTPAQISDEPVEAGDTVLAFGFGSQHGRVLIGEVRGTAVNGPFLAMRLGAGHGDSGGPVFDVRTGKVIGIISSDARTDMTDGFSREAGTDGRVRSQWNGNGRPLGADTLVVHVAAIMGR